jgi:hypothetical protein
MIIENDVAQTQHKPRRGDRIIIEEDEKMSPKKTPKG